MNRSRSFTLLLGALLSLPTLSFAFTWTELPGPATPKNAAIYSIAALSSSDVWSVGSGADGKTLTEHWDGSTWSVVPSPVVSGELNSVAVRAADDVWAVGDVFVSSLEQSTLIEHWDGTRWTVIPSPSPGAYDTLSAISIVSANDIWAVGETLPDFYSPGSILLLHWDGTAWTLVDGPPASFSGLNGVKAFASDNVWAVGFKDYDYDAGMAATFIIHWDGASWSEVPSPSGDAYDVLSAIDGASPNDIWALGASGLNLNERQTLALHWDGTAWAAVRTPQNGGTFTGLKVINSTKVIAVGNGGLTPPFTEVWNGTRWSISPTPSFSGFLFGVTYADKVAFAAGYQRIRGGTDELYLTATRNQ